MIYEILPLGFDGGTDAMDAHVLWVEAGSIDHVKLYAARSGCDPESVQETAKETHNRDVVDLYIDSNGEITDTESGTTLWN